MKQLHDGIGGDSGTKEKALDLITALFFQIPKLPIGFDPFSNDTKIQTMAQCDDRFGDRRILRVRREIFDKCAINFDCVDGEAFEITERGITCTKIINSEPDSQFFQVMQGFHGFFHVPHNHNPFAIWRR